jgi:hypothetical protein
MQRHKLTVLDGGQFVRNDYFYYEKEVELLIEALKGVVAERDDPRNKDRFLAPIIHYMTADSEMSVWEAARRFIKEWDNKKEI